MSQPFTVTIPVTFTMINGAGWSHGHIPFGARLAWVSQQNNTLGQIGSDMGGSPVVEMHGATFTASNREIFGALHAAVKADELPKENPEPHK